MVHLAACLTEIIETWPSAQPLLKITFCSVRFLWVMSHVVPNRAPSSFSLVWTQRTFVGRRAGPMRANADDDDAANARTVTDFFMVWGLSC